MCWWNSSYEQSKMDILEQWSTSIPLPSIRYLGWTEHLRDQVKTLTTASLCSRNHIIHVNTTNCQNKLKDFYQSKSTVIQTAYGMCLPNLKLKFKKHKVMPGKTYPFRRADVQGDPSTPPANFVKRWHSENLDSPPFPDVNAYLISRFMLRYIHWTMATLFAGYFKLKAGTHTHFTRQAFHLNLPNVKSNLD